MDDPLFNHYFYKKLSIFIYIYYLYPKYSYGIGIWISTAMNSGFSLCMSVVRVIKVHIFWEGLKILQNLHLTFDCMYCSQKLGENFAEFCGLLRIYELYCSNF